MANRSFPAAVAFVLAVACPAAGQAPEAGKEKWTHKELHEHLTKSKVGVRMVPGSPGNAIIPPSVYFVFAATDKEELEALERYIKLSMTEPRVIICRKMPTADQARDSAGVNPKRSFAWGRFTFECDRGGEANLSKFHEAITGKPFKP